MPVERAAQLGDLATLDYEGKIGDTPFEGGTATGQTTELDEGRFVPGFVAGIVGMQPGETKNVPVRFPDDYPAQELAGKDAVFTITLHELKEIELPALDDEFAKAVSTNQTVDELRADLRRRLEAVDEGRSRRVLGNALMSQLLAAHEFALPATMVEGEVDRLLEDAGPPPAEDERSRRRTSRGLARRSRIAHQGRTPDRSDCQGGEDRCNSRRRGVRARSACAPLRSTRRPHPSGAGE